MNQYLASIGSISKVTRSSFYQDSLCFARQRYFVNFPQYPWKYFPNEQIDSARRDDEVEKSSAAALVEKGRKWLKRVKKRMAKRMAWEKEKGKFRDEKRSHRWILETIEEVRQAGTYVDGRSSFTAFPTVYAAAALISNPDRQMDSRNSQTDLRHSD
ncbi:LOW QUALITY PROTEIN: hypothetical protein V1477_008703 [Vespula maculifrons]|uniref:Uncharacterized protein n=1 Tax=Vespula maculifrons TaxID=7453 RepID=A0ABD2CDR8_VESMC